MITGSIFNSKTPNKSFNSSTNIQSLSGNNRKPLTNPVSRGGPSNFGSNSSSRGMSFMVGSVGNISEIDRYDNYMVNVIYFLF